MSKLTPMLQQYMDIKKNTKDALVFYRLGDFYELFFEDAITASKALDLVLTARSAGNDQKAPMCGVPHHAAKNYIQKLIAKGYKVAIVEQVEDPKSAKGIVRREIIEIVTPGTYFEFEENETREIASIQLDLVYATLVSCDLVSGSVRGLRVMNDALEIIKTLQQFQVKEIVVDETFDTDILSEIRQKTSIMISYESKLSQEVTHKDPFIKNALARLAYYLEYTQKRKLTHLQPIKILNDQAYLRMDYATMTNLELLDHQHQKQLSLYHFINRTRTNMGARRLKQLLMQPYVTLEPIQKQHERIDVFIHNLLLKDAVASLLKDSYDIHKIIARMTTDKHNAHDFLRLRQTLHTFKELQDALQDYDPFSFVRVQDALEPVYETLNKVIRDDAPALLKEGKTFRKGINQELDELLDLSQNGKTWLLDYERQERERTGIKNLKVGYTRAFGYYIEISKGQIENVKDTFGYIRKQTLTNAERYISEPLQDYEVRIEQATERILAIEQELFDVYTEYVRDYTQSIHNIGDILAEIDVVFSLSDVALTPGYVKPMFNNERKIEIKEGRHPVLEASLKDHQYIASDVDLDESRRVLVLTGPNMGGKSTYMRMLAHNVVLAQIGSYVPCASADLELADQIFTRMGASDDILLGQSTFMVEMTEAQLALSRATRKSLILFDEIGRGTSTYDGMALAQAIIEYIVYSIGAKTVFSTHYHELVTLESMHEGVKNIHVDVYEENDHVTFLYKVIDGKADKSYGINVARLAHLPQTVLQRAREILDLFEVSRDRIDLDRKIVRIEVEPAAYTAIKTRIENLDTDNLKPIEALMLLEELKGMLNHDED